MNIKSSKFFKFEKHTTQPGEKESIMHVNQLPSSEKPALSAHEIGVSFKANSQVKELKSMTFEWLSGKRSQKSDHIWALKHIDLTVYTGEVLGVIGHNGAGKSTLCRVISKILNPDTGDIQVEGQVSALLSLGTGFNKELTGKENIFLNGMMLGFRRKEIQRMYHDIVEFADIGDFIEQPIKKYSSGMKARLGFSIAAMLKPDILVLDEALSTGDAVFREKASHKIQEILGEAKLVIIVSHSLEFIESQCTQAIWIDQGEIRAYGSPGSVCAQYKETATKQPNKKRIIANLRKTETAIAKENVIEANHLSLKYKIRGKDFWALKDVSFSVKKGEIVGIIGHNGAGKSTLCRIFTKILQPDEGTLSINGGTTALLGFGAGFNSQLTASDNIYLNGLMLGITKREIAHMHDKIIEFAELEKHVNKPLKNYSRGMVARLGFSIATMIQPEIFIIDEALSAGDVTFYEKATGRIQQMISSSKAVIVVTHSVRFVEQVCTRAIWLHKGSIKADGDPKEILQQYADFNQAQKHHQHSRDIGQLENTSFTDPKKK
jgi:teichoic acid transport system ATP-binding protein